MKKIIKKFGVEGKKPYVVLIKEYDVTGCYEPDIDDVDQFNVQFNVIYIIKWDGREIFRTVNKRMAKRVFRQVKKFCKSVKRMLYEYNRKIDKEKMA